MGVKITEEELARMQARVSGAVQKAVEPVRATLPAQFVILGHAVSVNNSTTMAKTPARGTFLVKTEERRVWDRMMVEQFRAQWNLRLPIEEEVFLVLEVYLSANTMDVDNALKPVQDAMQEAGVLKNDRLVRRATITKHVDRHRPRVEVIVYPSTLKPL